MKEQYTIQSHINKSPIFVRPIKDDIIFDITTVNLNMFGFLSSILNLMETILSYLSNEINIKVIELTISNENLDNCLKGSLYLISSNNLHFFKFLTYSFFFCLIINYIRIYFLLNAFCHCEYVI